MSFAGSSVVAGRAGDHLARRDRIEGSARERQVVRDRGSSRRGSRPIGSAAGSQGWRLPRGSDLEHLDRRWRSVTIPGGAARIQVRLDAAGRPVRILAFRPPDPGSPPKIGARSRGGGDLQVPEPDRSGIVESVRECGLALFYVPSQRNGAETIEDRREDKGNAILSSLPIDELIAIELPFEAGRKVAVAATVRTGNGVPIRLVNLHLDIASPLYRTLTRANTARLRQTVGLLQALLLIETGGAASGTVSVGSGAAACGAAPAIATLLAGDFNTWSAAESSIDQVRLCFPDSPPWDGRPTRGTFPTDFIFFKQGADRQVRYIEGSEKRIDERYGSDHHARIAWFGARE